MSTLHVRYMQCSLTIAHAHTHSVVDGRHTKNCGSKSGRNREPKWHHQQNACHSRSVRFVDFDRCWLLLWLWCELRAKIKQNQSRIGCFRLINLSFLRCSHELSSCVCDCDCDCVCGKMNCIAIEVGISEFGKFNSRKSFSFIASLRHTE